MTQYERGGCWLYGRVAPDGGDAFWLILPQRNVANMQICLDEFAKAYPDSCNILLMDNAGAHTAQSLRIPENLGLRFQPPRCPELNPAERVWQDLRSTRAWQRFAHIEVLEDERVAQFSLYRPATLMSLTGYPYLVQAYHAACL